MARLACPGRWRRSTRWRGRCGAAWCWRGCWTSRWDRPGWTGRGPRRRVLRDVEDVIGREAGPGEGERLRAELLERLERPEFDTDLRDWTVEEVVALVCRDLGLGGHAGDAGPGGGGRRRMWRCCMRGRLRWWLATLPRPAGAEGGERVASAGAVPGEMSSGGGGG